LDPRPKGQKFQGGDKDKGKKTAITEEFQFGPLKKKLFSLQERPKKEKLAGEAFLFRFFREEEEVEE